jgi:hypothetical protein
MSGIIPTGAPAWTRTADHTVYGGDLNKKNWHDQGVTNTRTDLGADQLCRLAADLAAVTLTAPFALITIGSFPGLPYPTVLAVNQQSAAVPAIAPVDNTARLSGIGSGVQVSPYDGALPPTGFPSVSVTRRTTSRAASCAASRPFTRAPRAASDTAWSRARSSGVGPARNCRRSSSTGSQRPAVRVSAAHAVFSAMLGASSAACRGRARRRYGLVRRRFAFKGPLNTR